MRQIYPFYHLILWFKLWIIIKRQRFLDTEDVKNTTHKASHECSRKRQTIKLWKMVKTVLGQMCAPKDPNLKKINALEKLVADIFPGQKTDIFWSDFVNTDDNFVKEE